MNRRLWTLGACALFLASVVFAEDKPDFSGFWKINNEKSDFGMMPKPDKYEVTIDHKDPVLKAKVTQAGQMGERTSESTYKTDGTESVNKAQGPQGEMEIKSTAKWEGKNLTLVTKREIQGADITINQKWTLAEDGKTMTIDLNVNTPQGDLQMKQVLDKQPTQ